jgi:hypothetical protein
MSNPKETKEMTAEEAGVPTDAAAYMKSLEDTEVIERVRCVIKDSHVFKLPTRQTAGGWRGADWTEEVWQGTVKVVERGELTVVLLVDRVNGSIFAVCPIKDGAIDRCVDSSRYFVLRIENANGRHMFIGMAFNERNDAFDFNTSLEDAKREREAAKEPAPVIPQGPAKDYSIKDGEKIRVKIKNIGGFGGGDDDRSAATSTRKLSAKTEGAKKKGGFGGFALKPSSKDTAKRAGEE